MVKKEIFETYRKIHHLGFSKEESYKIFKKNISCIDYFLGNYVFLNQALDEVLKIKIEKKNISSKINEFTWEAREKAVAESNLMNPFISIFMND